jgi:hypothetical protein
LSAQAHPTFDQLTLGAVAGVAGGVSRVIFLVSIDIIEPVLVTL